MATTIARGASLRSTIVVLRRICGKESDLSEYSLRSTIVVLRLSSVFF